LADPKQPNWVREIIAPQIGKRGKKAAVAIPALLAVLKNRAENWELRSLAAKALAKTKDRSVTPTLSAISQDSAEPLRLRNAIDKLLTTK